jgi:thioredoxin reductase (NADPH)
MKQIKPFEPEFFLNTDIKFVERHELGNYTLQLSNGETLMTRNIFMASGPGKFIPRRPDVHGLAEAEANNIVDYAVKNIEEIIGDDVIIFGGGDSAIDWALELQNKCRLTLIHRSEKFKAVPANVEGVKASDDIRKFFGWKPEKINGNEVTINRKGERMVLKADKVFMFFGLLTDVNLVQGLPEDIYNEDKRIPVDTENFQSSTPGIFAIGDCNDYPGKLKLILSGFHETTLAVQEAYRRIHKSDPEFMYTTTSTALQEKLNRNDNNN